MVSRRRPLVVDECCQRSRSRAFAGGPAAHCGRGRAVHREQGPAAARESGVLRLAGAASCGSRTRTALKAQSAKGNRCRRMLTVQPIPISCGGRHGARARQRSARVAAATTGDLRFSRKPSRKPLVVTTATRAERFSRQLDIQTSAPHSTAERHAICSDAAYRRTTRPIREDRDRTLRALSEARNLFSRVRDEQSGLAF
jgi:hypothetical protein